MNWSWCVDIMLNTQQLHLFKIIFFETIVLVYTVPPVSFLKLIYLLHLVRPEVKLIMYVDYMFHTVVSWQLICLCCCFES